MDIDDLQQNMNTRVVFREPRGFIRWIQLFFAIIAFATVVDFSTNLTVTITCPTSTNSTNTPSTPSTTNSSTTTVAPPASSAAPVTQAQTVQATFNIHYPFYFQDQKVSNTCPGATATYTHPSSLDVSPKFFVMTGVLSLIYASSSLVVYLLFSSTYDSIPVMPVADLIVTIILCLFWFVAAAAFSSSVSLLKSTVTYEAMSQVLCQPPYSCPEANAVLPTWKSLNAGLVAGYTSFFLWGANTWFVYKETHFHGPQDHFGLR